MVRTHWLSEHLNMAILGFSAAVFARPRRCHSFCASNSGHFRFFLLLQVDAQLGLHGDSLTSEFSRHTVQS